jgi:hypothetical protein
VQDASVIETAAVTAELVVETGAERRDFGVSIYTPLVPGGYDARQNRIRLTNQARTAVSLLTGYGMRPEHARRLVSPLFEIAERTADPSARTPPAIATFIASGTFRFFGINHPVEESVTSGRRFHTRPLLDLIGLPARVYVLTLSRGLSRLWLVAGSGVAEVEVSGMPESVDDLAQFDDPEPSLQTHSTGAGARGFHGQGHGEDADEQLMEDYVRRVARAVAPFVTRRDAVFLLASPEELASIFHQEIGPGSVAVDRVLAGSFDRASEAEIREMAQAALDEHAHRKTAQVDRRLVELTAPVAGEALTEITEIVQAAYQGRLQELLMAPEFHAEGTFDPETGFVGPCRSPGDAACEDLADLAAVLTLRYGGDVHVAGPSESRKASQQVSAILRG